VRLKREMCSLGLGNAIGNVGRVNLKGDGTALTAACGKLAAGWGGAAGKGGKGGRLISSAQVSGMELIEDGDMDFTEEGYTMA
jgi:hypothetical protein